MGGHVIQYRRLGAGSRRAVFLSSTPIEQGDWAGVLGMLVLQHRLYVPVLQRPFDAEFADTLRGFLDGVGADTAVLIAAAPWSRAALDFAVAEADRIEQLILLASGADAAAALEEDIGQTTLSGLVLRSDRPEPTVLEALSRFLDQPPRDF